MLIFPVRPPIARKRSSGETAIETMSSECWMRPSWVCVAMFHNMTVRRVEHAMNLACFGRTMHESLLVSGTNHSETVDPVDVSICFILLSDTTKRWLIDQRRLVLNNGVTVALMSTSKRPSLLSQTRTDLPVAVAMRLPCGEYLAARTELPWASVRTRLRVAMSQMVAILLSDAETSRVESGEKSTPLTVGSFLCEKTSLCVFASHTITLPQYVPAVWKARQACSLLRSGVLLLRSIFFSLVIWVRGTRDTA
jgi:hypothetical protein